jgi:hypothetical protein
MTTGDVTQVKRSHMAVKSHCARWIASRRLHGWQGAIQWNTLAADHHGFLDL